MSFRFGETRRKFRKQPLATQPRISSLSLSAELDPLLSVVEGDGADLGAHQRRRDEVRPVVAHEPLEGARLTDLPLLDRLRDFDVRLRGTMITLKKVA